MQLQKDSKEELFRVYVSDALKAIADNSSKLIENGISLKSRYIEIVEGIKPDEKPQETAEQIKKRIADGVNSLSRKNKEGAEGENTGAK